MSSYFERLMGRASGQVPVVRARALQPFQEPPLLDAAPGTEPVLDAPQATPSSAGFLVGPAERIPLPDLSRDRPSSAAASDRALPDTDSHDHHAGSKSDPQPAIAISATRPAPAGSEVAPAPPSMARQAPDRTLHPDSRLMPEIADSAPSASTRPDAHQAFTPRKLPLAELGAREVGARSDNEPNEVHITIGRIEVTAARTAAPQKRARPTPHQPLSLDAYLSRRRGGP
jgi:hypothetical protein